MLLDGEPQDEVLMVCRPDPSATVSSIRVEDST